MGCDSHLYLPPTTRLRDFTDVLAALLGAPMEQQHFSGGDGWAAHSEHGAEWTTTPSIPEMLVLGGKVGSIQLGGYWHWESDNDIMPGARLFSCRTAESRRPVLEALADAFGGVLDFNDCDSIEADYVGSLRNKPYTPNANDGAGWEAWQQAKLAVQQVSKSW